LMDEPLSALDKSLREHMQIELRNLHRRLGMTTVYVTHDQREAITMSDRIAVMNAGCIEQIDRPEVLYAAPKTRFVAGFIGDSNFIPVESRNGSVWYEDRKIRMTSAAPAAGCHLMVVRPEKLRLVADAPPAGSVNVIPATVGDVIYQGDSFACYATLRDGRQVTLRDYCRSDVLAKLPRPGEPVNLGIDADDVVLVAAD
ncbi:MAG: ABC transporter ATP-binding protein, partial [Mesorhizobium sp.]